MRYLLDTDWIIQVLAGRKEAVLAHKRIHPEDMAVSYITIGEIYDVAFSYANPQAHLHTFRQFLAPFPLLDLTEPIMERFAEIRSYLRRRGELISDFDILIGASALSYDLTLLTYNRRHFKRIPDLKLYLPAA
jgi:tRNA(fMet)-specific endonuclease VapC